MTEPVLLPPVAARVDGTASLSPLNWRHFLKAPWPFHPAQPTQGPTLRAIDPEKAGAPALLDQGHCAHEGDVRDPPHGEPGLLPFVVHKAHCQQARQRDDGPMMRTNLRPLPSLATSCTKCPTVAATPADARPTLAANLVPLLPCELEPCASCGAAHRLAKPPLSISCATAHGMGDHQSGPAHAA